MQLFKKIIDYSTKLLANHELPWAHEIDTLEDLAAIELTTARLTEDLKNGVYQDHQHLEAFFAMDEKTHPIAKRITEDYLETDFVDIDHEERIANAVFLYHREIFATYLALLRNPAPVEHLVLHTMLLRAMNTATAMVKWRFYKFQSAPANIWLQISKLYKVAEKHFLQNEAMAIYFDPTSAEQKLTTISSMYIQACMLGSLEGLSFKSQQIELAHKILDFWAAKVSIDRDYDSQKYFFYVDTGSNTPAKRIRKFKPTENCRYWSLDGINSKVELCLSLLEFNIAPKQEKIKEIVNSKYALITLGALQAEWSRIDPSRQRRSLERVKTEKAANTTFGFEETCDRIRHYESISEHKVAEPKSAEIILTEKDTNHESIKGRGANIIYVDLGAGQSNIVDESQRGFGLLVRKQASELSIGMMIGVSAKEKSHDIKVGVIRNIKPVAGNQFHLGIELLSRAAFCAKAENVSRQLINTTSANQLNDTISGFSNDFTRFTCLFLPKEFSVSKQETLIVPRYQYNRKDAFKINIAGHDMLVRLTDSFEQHENWVRVAFTKAY